jgi:hypothetical protein
MNTMYFFYPCARRASAHSRYAAFVYRVETAEENCACLASLQVAASNTQRAIIVFLSVLIDVLLQERGREKEKWREVWAVVFGV